LDYTRNKNIKRRLYIQQGQYNRLIAKSNNKIKITWNVIRKETWKIHVTEQIPSFLIKDEQVNDPEKVADVFSC
jgi:hypothetical protein